VSDSWHTFRDESASGVKVVLIRHAAVTVEPNVPSSGWQLTPAGLRAASRLGKVDVIRAATVIATSPEPKATGVAAAIANGRRVREVADLSELDRSRAGWLASEAEYAQLVRQIFEQPLDSIRGCESASHAQARFVAAIDALREQHPSAVLGVVSHGLVLSLYVAYIRGLPAPDLADWQRLGMPDLA